MWTRPSKIFLIALLVLFIGFLLFHSRKHQPPSGPDIELLPIHIGSGWGYRILIHNHPFLYQPDIPVYSGHRPFASRKQALSAGGLVVQKLLHGERPELSRMDLDSLGIAPDSI